VVFGAKRLLSRQLTVFERVILRALCVMDSYEPTAVQPRGRTRTHIASPFGVHIWQPHACARASFLSAAVLKGATLPKRCTSRRRREMPGRRLRRLALRHTLLSVPSASARRTTVVQRDLYVVDAADESLQIALVLRLWLMLLGAVLLASSTVPSGLWQIGVGWCTAHADLDTQSVHTSAGRCEPTFRVADRLATETHSLKPSSTAKKASAAAPSRERPPPVRGEILHKEVDEHGRRRQISASGDDTVDELDEFGFRHIHRRERDTRPRRPSLYSFHSSTHLRSGMMTSPDLPDGQSTI
jgi:hypothetical protein